MQGNTVSARIDWVFGQGSSEESHESDSMVDAERVEALRAAGPPTPLLGVHHVTMLASDALRNLRFYTQVLGLRLIKATVNMDSPQSWHLYYGDGSGSPGSGLTFFPFGDAAQGRQGAGLTNVVRLAIPPASLGWWLGWLLERGATYSGPERRQLGQTITLRDPDGLQLELVADADAKAAVPWEKSPVPVEHQIRRVHSVSLWEEAPDVTATYLQEVLGGVEAAAPNVTDDAERVVRIGAQLATVRNVRGFWGGEISAGSVHHVAWRVADDAALEQWQAYLAATQPASAQVTPIRERFYFRSVYFQEPGGARLELATDGPGFTIDEPLEELGTGLRLPPWLEEFREMIVQVLPPLPLGQAAGDAVAYASVWNALEDDEAAADAEANDAEQRDTGEAGTRA